MKVKDSMVLQQEQQLSQSQITIDSFVKQINELTREKDNAGLKVKEQENINSDLKAKLLES